MDTGIEIDNTIIRIEAIMVMLCCRHGADFLANNKFTDLMSSLRGNQTNGDTYLDRNSKGNALFST